MKKFELSPVFLIGHDKIDSDHAGLVRILNEMVDGCNGEDVKCCHQKWQQFYQTLRQHFIDEASIMIDYGYTRDPLEHQKILTIVKSMGEDCKDLNCWENFLFTVRNELLSWILKKDMLFAEHLITIGYNNP